MVNAEHDLNSYNNVEKATQEEGQIWKELIATDYSPEVRFNCVNEGKAQRNFWLLKLQ